MPRLRFPRARARCGASLGVLAIGLCLAPSAVSAPGHGGPVSAAGYGAPVSTAPVHGGNMGGPPGLAGGWGGAHGGPPGGGYGNGAHGGPAGGGYGYGHGAPVGGGYGSGGQGGYGSSSQAQPSAAQPSAVAQPSAAAQPQATPSASSSSHGNGNAYGYGHSNGNGNSNGSGNGNGHGNGNAYGYGHSSGSGSGNGNGHSSSSSSGSGNGNAASPAASSASQATRSTPSVTTAASSAAATPAAATPAAATPAAAAPSASAPTAPAASTPSAPAAKSKKSGKSASAPTGKSSQRASSRSSRRSGGQRAGSSPSAAPRTSAGRRAATAGRAAKAHAVAAELSPAGAARHQAQGRSGSHHHRTVAAAAAPLTALGHDLTSVPRVVGHLVPLPVPDWSKPIIVGLVLICLLLGLRAWLTGHRARRLESHGRQLAADLEAIQSALNPEIPPRLGGLDVSVAYRPADGPGAGGDFYDAFALGGERVAVIVGDVSGHGRDALGRAAHMHYTLRAYVEMGLDPRSALKLAGRVVGTDDDDLFTTVAVAIHDAGAATLTYATAGHPAPVTLGPGAHEPLTRCASPALGWGVPTGRRQTTISFPEGARACFFTDGVTEARVDDELLGRARLGEILAGLSADASAADLLADVRRRAHGVHDDMAACLVHASAGVPLSEQRTEELEVDTAQIAAGQAQRFLDACGVAEADAAAAMADARALAGERGATVLRVVLEDGEATATAHPVAPVTVDASATAPEPAAA